MKVLVTGGSGFIGSALVHHLIREAGHSVVNVDALTYAANPASLADVDSHTGYSFEHANVCDLAGLHEIFSRHQPDAVAHLAAESHVDRSIDGPAVFVHTNLVGTYNVLEAARSYQQERNPRDFRVLHVSTDEVFGSLGAEGLFDAESQYDPSSPYSASKAGADHLATAWHRTFGLPIVLVNMCNAYGPWQFPEKLIPLTILNGLMGRSMPVYGTGNNVREWIYVDDAARALATALLSGRPGESYLVGTGNERTNIDTVRTICQALDRARPDKNGEGHERLISFVADRPGHDARYAIDSTKIRRELGWAQSETGESGMERTVKWYIENEGWWRSVHADRYDGERLGLSDGGRL